MSGHSLALDQMSARPGPVFNRRHRCSPRRSPQAGHQRSAGRAQSGDTLQSV